MVYELVCTGRILSDYYRSKSAPNNHFAGVCSNILRLGRAQVSIVGINCTNKKASKMSEKNSKKRSPALLYSRQLKKAATLNS